MFASGKTGDGERVDEPERAGPTSERRAAAPRGRAASRRVEGKGGGHPAGRDSGEPRRAARVRATDGPATDRGCSGRAPSPCARAARQRAQLVRPAAPAEGRRSRVEDERARDGLDDARGRSGRTAVERRRRPAGSVGCVSPGRRPRTDARLPGPPRAARRRAQTSAAAVAPSAAAAAPARCRRACRERRRARSACRTPPSGRARSRAAGRRRASGFGEQHVRRLHVAVDDSAARGRGRARRRSAPRPRSPRGRRARRRRIASRSVRPGMYS